MKSLSVCGDGWFDLIFRAHALWECGFLKGLLQASCVVLRLVSGLLRLWDFDVLKHIWTYKMIIILKNLPWIW
jgi:hypothetical protein